MVIKTSVEFFLTEASITFTRESQHYKLWYLNSKAANGIQV